MHRLGAALECSYGFFYSSHLVPPKIDFIYTINKKEGAEIAPPSFLYSFTYLHSSWNPFFNCPVPSISFTEPGDFYQGSAIAYHPIE